MTKVVDLNFLHPPAAQAGSGTYVIMPGVNGVGDTNCIRTGSGTGRATTNYAITTGRMNYPANASLRGATRTAKAIRIEDETLGSWTQPYADIWLGEGTTGSKEGSPVDDPAALTTWSARLIFRIPTTPGTDGQGYNYIQLRRDNTALAYQPGTWRESAASFWGLYGTTRVTGQNRTSGATSGATWYRMELQADNSQTNRLAMRLYADDGTTLLGTQVAYVTSTNIADISIDCIRLGDTNTTSPGGTGFFDYAEIEVWDTNNADGQMTDQWDALDTPEIGVFFETSPGNTGYPRSATYSIPAGYTTPSDSTSPPVALVESSTQFSDVEYGDKTEGTNFTLYLPDVAANAPTDGYPLILWFHGGFGVAGDKTGLDGGLDTNFRNRVLGQGWAIATANYVRGTVATSISAYGTDVGTVPGYGSLQSMICNAKLAIIRMKQKGRGTSTAESPSIVGDDTYPINVNNIVVMGGSFGGYLALASVLSKGVTDTGTSNTNLTLAANSTFAQLPGGAGAYTGTDPTVQGVLGVVPPDNIRFARDTDLTEAITGTNRFPTFTTSLTETVDGVSGAACKAVMRVANGGTAPTDAELDEFSITNITSLAPSVLSSTRVAIMSGTADRLVNRAHKTALDLALASGSGYTSFTSPANHDYGMAVMPWDDGTSNDIQSWLNATFNPGGGGGGSGTTIPDIPTIPTIPSL